MTLFWSNNSECQERKNNEKGTHLKRHIRYICIVFSSTCLMCFVFPNRHIIFAPSRHNKYAGESFPGIYDAMFDIENKADPRSAWTEVKKHISIAAFTIQAAAETLKEVV